MTGPFATQAYREMIERYGYEVDHHFYQRAESDGREAWTEHPDSPEQIVMVPDTVGGVGIDRSQLRVRVDGSRMYFCDSTDAANVRGGGGTGASEIHDGDREYVVLNTHTLNAGFTTLDTEYK